MDRRRHSPTRARVVRPLAEPREIVREREREREREEEEEKEGKKGEGSGEEDKFIFHLTRVSHPYFLFPVLSLMIYYLLVLVLYNTFHSMFVVTVSLH